MPVTTGQLGLDLIDESVTNPTPPVNSNFERIDDFLEVLNDLIAAGGGGGVTLEDVTQAIATALVDYIKRDGTVAMTGALTLSGDPTEDNHAARKAYVLAAITAAVNAIDLTPYLPKAGGTLTGALTLSGDPVDNLHAATKQWVLARVQEAVIGELDVNTLVLRDGSSVISAPQRAKNFRPGFVELAYAANVTIDLAAAGSWHVAVGGAMTLALANAPQPADAHSARASVVLDCGWQDHPITVPAAWAVTGIATTVNGGLRSFTVPANKRTQLQIEANPLGDVFVRVTVEGLAGGSGSGDITQAQLDASGLQALRADLTVSQLVDASGVAIDMNGAAWQELTMAGQGSYTFSLANAPAPGATRVKVVHVDFHNPQVSSVALVFPADWKWRSTKPTACAAGKGGTLTVACTANRKLAWVVVEPI